MYKRVFPAILALLLVAASALAEAGGDYELARISETSIQHFDGSDYTSTVNYDYDARGLITSVEMVQDSGEAQSTEVAYAFDAQGNPERLTLEMEDSRVEFLLENTYQDGVLTEARLVDMLMDGKSARNVIETGDPASLSAATVSNLQIPLRCLYNYTGYRDATVSLATSELRWANGERVYTCEVYPGTKVEYEYAYPTEGGVTTTNRTFLWTESGWEAQETYVMETDAEHFLRAVHMPDESGELRRVPLRYEATDDPETGATLCLGYYDPEAAGLGDLAVDEEMLAQPVVRYELDGEGRVVQEEKTVESGFAQTAYYDVKGRLTRTETWNNGELFQYMVYSYR